MRMRARPIAIAIAIASRLHEAPHGFSMRFVGGAVHVMRVAIHHHFAPDAEHRTSDVLDVEFYVRSAFGVVEVFPLNHRTLGVWLLQRVRKLDGVREDAYARRQGL